jgi:hypothetical protein
MCSSLYFFQNTSQWLLLVLSIGTGLSVGCGKPSDAVARLSGEVTLDGQPLPGDSLGSVSFQSIDIGKARATSAQIINGRYDCPNVPRREVLAHIRLSIPTGRTYRDERTGKDVSELENVVLTAEQEDGIELNVTGNDIVNFELHRAKKSGRAGR